MKRLVDKLIILGVCMATQVWPVRSWSESGMDGRKQVVLEGQCALLSVDVAGGSIVDFHLNDQKLNPLTWNYPEKGDTKPRFMGHFICFDRWGAPSAQESKNGMPFHGEAATVEWDVLSSPAKRNGKVTAEMRCRLPIGGMELKRAITLAENTPIVTVREEITNINALGRLYNIVQHATLGPEYLDESVLVDSNAWKGFAQGEALPTPEEPALYWPKFVYKGELSDLRNLRDNQDPNVTSFVFADSLEYGWVTAVNPVKGLLIGYTWKLSEYPWLNIWRHVEDGKPGARGLEFGTSGLHQPYDVLVAKGKIFGHPLYEYIDAGQTVTKSYTMFLSRVPEGYEGVKDVRFRNGDIVISERGDGAKEIVVRGK